jgi:UDP-N-acetyl-D-galactosamine dehydrogenase
MTERRLLVADSRILVLGLTFKENCPDLRNSKVIDIVNELKHFDAKVDVYDPWVDAEAAFHEYGVRPIKAPKPDTYDAVVLAVSHDEFKALGIRKIRAFARKTHVVYDVKYMFAADQSDGRL